MIEPEAHSRDMARPPLTEEQVRAKVLAYCERYGVSPGPEGLPPFPTGTARDAASTASG